MDAVRVEIDRLFENVQRNAATVQRLEREQKAQLVRIAKLQREVNDLKMNKP